MYKGYKRIPRTRAQRLAEKGGTYFVNKAEDQFAILLKDEKKIEISKRGYPDFTVYNSDGTIYGFVEVKNEDESGLKTNQSIFKDFCMKHGHPFLRWTLDSTKEEIDEFLKDIS